MRYFSTTTFLLPAIRTAINSTVRLPPSMERRGRTSVQTFRTASVVTPSMDYGEGGGLGNCEVGVTPWGYAALGTTINGTAIPVGYEQCILIAGQSNAQGCARPDMSANSILPVKWSVGGTSIDVWAPGTTNYQLSLDRVGTMTPKAIWWIQGEADAFTGTVNTYASKLTALCNGWRASLSAPTLPIIVALLNSNAQGGMTAVPQMRAAQMSVCDADPYTYPFEMSGYTMAADFVHYDAATYITIGNDLAAYTLTLL